MIERLGPVKCGVHPPLEKPWAFNHAKSMGNTWSFCGSLGIPRVYQWVASSNAAPNHPNFDFRMETHTTPWFWSLEYLQFLRKPPIVVWLVVSTPLKNISQFGWLFPIYGKIKHVPNHQAVVVVLGLSLFPTSVSSKEAWYSISVWRSKAVSWGHGVTVNGGQNWNEHSPVIRGNGKSRTIGI